MPSKPQINLQGLGFIEFRVSGFRASTLNATLRQTLDCVFDSGLRDTELHGMGPLGTEELSVGPGALGFRVQGLGFGV